MREVVVNRCYGGFGLSHKAVMRYAELRGLTLWSQPRYGYHSYFTVPVADYEELHKRAKESGNYESANEVCFSERGIDRDDPLLISVVKELGDESHGQYAELEIVEIPDDVAWEIDDYDGMERVAERHRTW